eukprot:CAMPEP_0197665120 /NCGR_PEP_ID=MMETSP1338-20131121/59041_1 /TAXON_ID=43686 ORGANISM="Pelagodinium beii, Strain RCC1491" /NCGR_SAMPLE_ID=MMETSP1338 /ASSEMBLY_ACC=CAM_ASM_000754 /LENGTH=972 /DNA_ID=CAMNT_0043243877 /DNA_START=73 /DNA_END=2988 /DNA_ORIENTATION=+
MKVLKDIEGVEDQLVYEIMYFSPIEVGDERYINQLYFQTDIYSRTWPQTMVDRMNAQLEQLKHCELGILSFDDNFKRKHREAVLFHCKMALAYLDSRQARIAMKLCEVVLPATRSSEPRIQTDPEADFDFLRVVSLSVMACAARRVKFYQKAVDALAEAKTICLSGGEQTRAHPLMTSLTLLNLSAVLGDIDHDEHGLRWGLEALAMMYNLFSTMELDKTVQAYYFVLACHNAALLNVKLGRWADAAELVDEGIEFTKVLEEAHCHDDGLRRKLIAIGAQAKQVPEGFLVEAVNAANGWGEERGVWNLSFWDFSIGEIREEIRVLEQTMTLKQIIIEHADDDRRYAPETEDWELNRFIMAVVQCQSLELITISGIDFDPRKVWRRIKKRGFLETSWYASALNFANILEDARKPEVGQYQQLLKNLNHFSKKLVITLVILGNETGGVDLSENGINLTSVSAIVNTLRFPERPERTLHVKEVVLRGNDLDLSSAKELARTWDPIPGTPWPVEDLLLGDDDDFAGHEDQLAMRKDNSPGVTSLDVSHNQKIGDQGFEALVNGVSKFSKFRILKADSIGLTPAGCLQMEALAMTRLFCLCLSNNAILSEGTQAVCKAMVRCHRLKTLQLDNCGIDLAGATALSELVRGHMSLQEISLAHNKLRDQGTIAFCTGASDSPCLQSVNLCYNEIFSDTAAEAVGDMMRNCETLVELILSGNHLHATAPPQIGSAIEHSHILTMQLEDMGFTADSIDDFLDHGAAETQDLQVMVLNNNPVGDEGLTIIAECLSIGLTDLSISNCSLTHESQATLLNLVSLSPNLRSLDLSNNHLGPTGCSDMVDWMTQNDKESFSLRTLELSGCALGDDGFLQLVPVLGSLNYLGLRNNGITSGGLTEVMAASQMVKLQTLDLEGNDIGEPGVHALTERFQQEHKRSLWNPKQLTSMIDVVILKNNKIIPSLAASTEAFLKIHNPLMTVVW